MKRILIFSLAYYPKHVAGAEVAIKEITDRISHEEIVFDMVTLNSGGQSKFEKIGNINVHTILNGVGPLQKLFYPFSAFLLAKKLASKNKYDATWAMMASYAGYAGYLFKRANPKTPFILSVQEGENFGRRILFGYLFKKIFKNADLIQVISNFLETWSRKMGAKCPVIVVPNAVDFKYFSTHKNTQEEYALKQKLNKKPNDIFLITTSRLVKKNDVETIIESLKYLSEEVKFLVLGTGRLENKLGEKVKELKLGDRVKFLGFIKNTDLPLYLHISDIFIRPSLSEGFGISYVEAMAAGIPVIATPVGGIVDFLKDGETGLFCEVKNPKSIAQKVEKLIKDKESREFIVQNAKQMVKEKYDWNLIANKMKTEVFLRVL
jgi:glycosyltransferase involved in cell wall biosynthesis